MDSRRDFIKKMAMGSCALAAAGIATSLEGCSPKSSSALQVGAEAKEAKVPLSSFNNTSYLIIQRAENSSVLVSKSGNAYKAVPMKCTHKGGPLKVEGDTMVCAWHGAKFSFNGTVTNGPAKEAISEFKTEVKGELLHVLFS